MTAATALRATAVELGDVPTAVLIAASRIGKRVAAAELVRAGRPRVRVWSKAKGTRRTVKLRVRDKLRDDPGGGRSLRLQGVPVGMWVWANTGTDPHLVGVGRTRGNQSTASRARKARYVFSPRYNHPVRAPVWHPGASGRLVWRRVVDETDRLTRAAFADHVRKVVAGRG